MKKKTLKIIIIIFIFIIGAAVTYFTVFKKKENNTPPAATEGPEETFLRCSDITDENNCNTVVDSVSGANRCEFSTTLNRCRNISLPVICENPEVVKDGFNNDSQSYSKYYYWEADESGQTYGRGTNKINQNSVLSDEPNPNSIILDFGNNPTEYCEWDNYDVEQTKYNRVGRCNFVLRREFYEPPSLENLNNLRNPRYATCQGNINGEQMFLVNTSSGNCTGILEQSSCDSIQQENDCNRNYTCLWDQGSCITRTGFGNLKYICGDLSNNMNNCYQYESEGQCPTSSCTWNTNRNRCLPIDYPTGGSNSDITPYYNFNDIDCLYNPTQTTIQCYTRAR